MFEEVIIQNQWWKQKSVDPAKLGKINRQDTEKLCIDIRTKKITCLLGPRRAGKTTLMYGLISHLIDSGTPPNRILFTSLDSPKIRLYLEKEFDAFIREYVSSIVKEPLDRLSATIYIFLDEIHKLNDWGNFIKYWQDLGLPIKFVISGSSSVRILKGSGESLLGRISFHTILPLKFSEFIGKKIECDFTNINLLKKANSELILEKQEIMLKLDDYLLKGGFPEVFDKDPDSSWEILREYKTLTITRDILDLKDIKEPRILNDLADILSESIGERINYSSFANILKIKVDTVKNYMTYLEEAFLIYTAYFYSKKQVISTRKEKKLLFIDHGLRNSLLLKEIDELEKTKIMENIIFIHILHLKKKELFPKIFYWLDDYRNELDIVAMIDKKIIPIEVKYSNKIDSRYLKGLVNFCRKYKTQGIVVTKDVLKEDEEEGITYVPAWLFLSVI